MPSLRRGHAYIEIRLFGLTLFVRRRKNLPRFFAGVYQPTPR